MRLRGGGGPMFLDAIALAFWPAIVGLVLFGWVRRADPAAVATPWATASVIAMAGIFYTVVFDVTSLVIVFNIFVGMILFGTLCLLAVYRCRSRLAVTSSVGLILFGVALVGIGSQSLIGDYMMERPVVHGTVQRLLILQTARGPNEYLVTIGDKSFHATTRLFATLARGRERARHDRPRLGIHLWDRARAAP